jgi:hypothetical protein
MAGSFCIGQKFTGWNACGCDRRNASGCCQICFGCSNDSGWCSNDFGWCPNDSGWCPNGSGWCPNGFGCLHGCGFRRSVCDQLTAWRYCGQHRRISVSEWKPPCEPSSSARISSEQPTHGHLSGHPSATSFDWSSFPVPSRSSSLHRFPCLPWPRHAAPPRGRIRRAFHSPLRYAQPDASACSYKRTCRLWAYVTSRLKWPGIERPKTRWQVTAR